jgi:hypothetical protein
MSSATFHVDVLLIDENSLESRYLFVSAQRLPGQQNPFHAVQRVTGPATGPSVTCWIR